MKRKIIITQCKDCHHMNGYSGTMKLDGYSGTKFFCENPENGNSPEEVDRNTIPDWCPLEKDE